MSTVDDAVEAGARALEAMYGSPPGNKMDMVNAEAVLRAAWPILSAPLRELHEDAGPSQGYTESGYGEIEHCCGTCGTHGEYGEEWPCPPMQTIIETDKELGYE